MSQGRVTPDDVQAAVGPVLEEVEVQMDLLDQQGRGYVFAYLAHTMGTAPQPKAPAGMHPLVARALRDLAMDEATALRMYGPPKSEGRSASQAHRHQEEQVS